MEDVNNKMKKVDISVSHSDDLTVKRIMAQYKKTLSEKNPYVKVCIDEDNVYIWYAILTNFSGDNEEYCYNVTREVEIDGKMIKKEVKEYGEYLFHILLPDDYPFNPPRFYAKTPNGMYALDGKCCISIGEYHNNSYKAVLGVGGFLMELVNGFIAWKSMGGGINLNVDPKSNEEKKKLARESKEFNKKNYRDIIKRINSNYEE